MHNMAYMCHQGLAYSLEGNRPLRFEVFVLKIFFFLRNIVEGFFVLKQQNSPRKSRSKTFAFKRNRRKKCLLEAGI